MMAKVKTMLTKEDRKKFKDMIIRLHLSRVRGVEVPEKVKGSIERDLKRLKRCYYRSDAEKLLKNIRRCK